MTAIKDLVAVVGTVAVLFLGLWFLVSVLAYVVIPVLGMILGAISSMV